MGNFLGKVESLWTLVPEENRADVVLQTLSYCNSYAVASGGRRVDVASTLNELAAQVGVFPSSEESDKFQAQLRDGMKPSYMMYSVQPKDFIVDHIQVKLAEMVLSSFIQLLLRW